MKVLVVGAGPAGIMIANCLVRRPGYDVHLVDKKPNPLDLPMSKSYPIQLQARGLEALREIPGLEELVASQGIRPVGVCFHQQGGSEQKISIDPPKLFCDHSQMTTTMLENLMQADAAKGSSLSVDFDCVLNNLDIDNKKVSVSTKSKKKSMSFDALVAADGGRSKVRHDLEQKNLIQVEQKDIPDEYRTICISKSCSDGSVNLDSDYIHGWVLDQGRIRIVAAPMDNDYLNGAFVSEKNHDPIANLKSPQDILDFFEVLSPKSLAKLVSMEEASRILNQSATSLVTVKCDRLHVKDCVLLIGDAAHAMTQSVGHGCISALQDVQVFCRLLDEYNDDWQQALPAYTRARLADAHALSIMSDYAVPTSQLMKVEWGVRQLVRKVLPSAFADLMRPLPVELLSDTTLSYSEVLENSGWWIDRVKISKSQRT
jgi:kynurenine 3-monooxygenase